VNPEEADKIEQWFSKNTFHYTDFIRVHRLVKRKNNQGLTIGVCIPTKNEEKTIFEIVRIIKEELVLKESLVDELIVMDSDSEDNTVKLAKKAGAKVLEVHDVMPEVAFPEKEMPKWGKGENVWKSIYALNTDILVWVDGDIENFNSRFIYGLVGPLLIRPDLGLVKGFYQRPIKMDGVLHSGGGGRVTELCLRPLLNIFYPELTRILQPLAGEYAVRREIIEKIPIFTNYAVETCMLIDIWKRWGLEIIGQVDLKERIHRNQGLAQLSKLSFGLMQAVFNRLDIHEKIKLLREPRWREGRYDFENIKIIEEQRPPICEIKEYQEKFKDRKPKWPKS
jgi:glucosyl-3-phosphoglycerate synthase